MLLAAGFVPSLVSLTALKSRAMRKGVWHRFTPAARALMVARCKETTLPQNTT